MIRIARLPWSYFTDNLRALVVKSDGSSSWSSLPYRIRWRVRNDDFAGRTVISGGKVEAEVKAVNTTREPGEPDHGAPALTRTLWRTWTAPGDGILQVRAAGPRTAVYQGATLDTLSLLGAADQSVRISVQSGASYQIALATLWDAAYMRLNYSPPPPDAPVTITGESVDHGTMDFRGEQLVRIPAPAADHKFFRIRSE